MPTCTPCTHVAKSFFMHADFPRETWVIRLKQWKTFATTNSILTIKYAYLHNMTTCIAAHSAKQKSPECIMISKLFIINLVFITRFPVLYVSTPVRTPWDNLDFNLIRKPSTTTTMSREPRRELIHNNHKNSTTRVVFFPKHVVVCYTNLILHVFLTQQNILRRWAMFQICTRMICSRFTPFNRPR